MGALSMLKKRIFLMAAHGILASLTLVIAGQTGIQSEV